MRYVRLLIWRWVRTDYRRHNTIPPRAGHLFPDNGFVGTADAIPLNLELMRRLAKAVLFANFIYQFFDLRVFMDCNDFTATNTADVRVMFNEYIRQFNLVPPTYLEFINYTEPVE